MVNADGDLWKSQRRYLINQKLGMRHWGSSGMEQIELRVQHEAKLLLDTLYREHNNAPLNPEALINCAVSNVICSMIMSTRFDHTSQELQHFMHIFDEGFRLFTLTGAMIYLPILKHMPGVAVACKKLRKNRTEMLRFVKKIIKTHQVELDPEQPKDLLDSYLIAIENMKSEDEAAGGNPTEVITSNNNNNTDKSANANEVLKKKIPSRDMFHGFDPEQQLEQIILDLFSAGVETVKTTLLWSIIYMLHNPEVMRKVQAELEEKVGSQRLPTVKDMNECPYTRATMCEVMRRSSVVPMGTTHSVDR